MQTVRQLGIGVIIAIVSVILVIGGIFLSLAESFPPSATTTQVPPTFPESFPTPTGILETVTSIPTETQTELPTMTPSLVLGSPTSCTPPTGWILITTRSGDTVYEVAERYKTTADNLNTANCLTAAELPVGLALYVPPVPTVTVIPCGPPFGWVRSYIVKRGDTLFSIALAYNTTYPRLQRGNCMGSSTTIYAGQRLWVPNVPTRTPIPGITVLPPTDTPPTSYP
ncbi:MAG TPA: LysM peptidoglycan-binding domain-containing protein [Anaerolineales bacterium]|jgi:LysM repeat protein|nr:LysM peptidoglycan-binding domain-containing protein [Anaerolineales bacterium]